MDVSDTLMVHPEHWTRVFDERMRVRVTLEAEDGTELYYFYPLADRRVVAGQNILLEFDVGLKIATS